MFKSLLCLRTQMLAWACVALLLASSNAALGNQDTLTSEPQILRFEALQTVVKGEAWYELQWEVSHTDRVKLFRDGRELPARTQLADGSIGWPATVSGFRGKATRPMIYELVVEVPDSEPLRKKLVIEPATKGRPPERPKPQTVPNIKSFRISPAVSEPEGEIDFYWDVENADRVRLYDELGEIDLRSTHKRNSGEVLALSTTLGKTTTFRLVADDRAGKTTSKTFTARVRTTTEPTEPAGTCTISGVLTGKWSQEIRERPTGPASTWIVKVYIYDGDSNRPFAAASVSGSGAYAFENLDAGKTYKIRPEWTASPEQANVSCRAGQVQRGPRFRITGSPHID